MGSVYKQKWKDKKGQVHESKNWWLKYYDNGKPLYENSKCTMKTDADRLLKQREGDIAKDKVPGIYFDRVLIDELAEDYLRNYRLKKKDIKGAMRKVGHVKKHFKGHRVTRITTPLIQGYIENRMKWKCKKCNHSFDYDGYDQCPKCESEDLKKGAANATINRELAALKAMLRLGAKQSPPKVDRVPYIPKLRENNVRTGFFEHGNFVALRNALPSYFKAFITLGYGTGMRWSEIAKLEWPQVDLDRGTVRLDPGSTKNDEGRTIYLLEDEKQLLAEQRKSQKKPKKLVPYVFPNADVTDRIKDIRGAWNTACRELGLGYGYKVSKKYVRKWRGKLRLGRSFTISGERL